MMGHAPDRRSRGGRPAVIARDDIVTAAIAVIDAEGLDALTMRRLGAELGVAAMSLYRHLPNRDAVLAAVVNRLATEAISAVDPGGSWVEALRRFAESYRGMLLTHPHAVPLLATHPIDIELGFELMAGVLERFTAAGVAQDDAVTAVQSVAVFTLGHALAQVGTPPGTEAPAADAETGGYYQRWFDTGLQAMLAGFLQRLGAS